MGVFENQVQFVKYEVLREVARYSFEGNLKEKKDFIPLVLNPGPEPRFRCCVYHEREVTKERIHMAQGGNPDNPLIVEILDAACDQCPVQRFTITENCRGCLAHRCEQACPVGAITYIGGKAIMNHSKCIECGRCAKACPYNAISDVKRPCRKACPTGAIEINEDKKAVINPDKCIECGACVYQCPFGAIQDKSEITEIIESLKGDRPVYAMVAPAFSTQYNSAQLGQIIAGIKALGFKDVIEVALGADLVSIEETKELASHLQSHSVMTSSCCPAFVHYVNHEYPELKDLVSTTVSPMIATSRLIKKIDPKAITVFIGPCVAKKSEKKQRDLLGDTEYVLTFEELSALIDAKGIALEELEPIPLNNASYFGRIFASTGGLTESVKHAAEHLNLDVEIKSLTCDGIKECDKALKLAKFNRQTANFIEGMACVGGCIKGPVTMHHGPKDKKAVESYGKLAMERDQEDALRVFDLQKISLHRHK
jgi:[FeFe] hydrogenase (group B1/B3)